MAANVWDGRPSRPPRRRAAGMGCRSHSGAGKSSKPPSFGSVPCLRVVRWQTSPATPTSFGRPRTLAGALQDDGS
eukprot:8495308-Lingulodinium_polyedra.AAC.1